LRRSLAEDSATQFTLRAVNRRGQAITCDVAVRPLRTSAGESDGLIVLMDVRDGSGSAGEQVPFSGQLDLILRELEAVDACLVELEVSSGDVRLARDLHGRLHASLAALTDLGTELVERRDELSHALDRERERYRELFELAPVAYLITSAAGVIQEANAAAAELLGVAPRYLLHKPLAVFVELDGRTAFRGLLRDSARGSEMTEHELPFVGRHGYQFFAAVTVRPVYEDHRLGGLRWLIRDVSERKRAEGEVRRLNAELEDRVGKRTRELETARARLATVIEQMPAGVMIVEPDGTLALANRQAEAIWGESFDPRSDTPAEGRGFDSAGRPLGPDEWPLARAVTTGDIVTGELVEIMRADGTAVVIEVNAAPVRDPDGRVVAGVQTFWDVTARERQERAEREFVTNAAHELQTPLTAITSAAEVLQAGAKEIPEDRDRFLAHIQNECDRLARLVQALLVLASAQTRGEPVSTERLRIKPVLEEVARRLRPASGVRIEVGCPPRLAAIANRDLVEQALGNIAGNAVKYTSEGSVLLTGRRLADDCVAIEVTDTGPGIPAEEQPRVFERFYRGGSRDRTGFGLGLAIAEQVARALGGRVELAPGQNGGTTVRLTLPAAAPA
jgi:PAS domain S-box-containing protein